MGTTCHYLLNVGRDSWVNFLEVCVHSFKDQKAHTTLPYKKRLDFLNFQENTFRGWEERAAAFSSLLTKKISSLYPYIGYQKTVCKFKSSYYTKWSRSKYWNPIILYMQLFLFLLPKAHHFKNLYLM